MRAQPTVVKDFKKTNEFTKLEEVSEFLNDLATELNYILKQISITNMNCQVVSIPLSASGETKIIHSLKVIPKYRIILRQDGSGVIYDVSSPDKWNRDFITLHNSGTAQTVTVAIFKE